MSLIRSKSAEGEDFRVCSGKYGGVYSCAAKGKAVPASLSYLDRAVLAAVSAMSPEDLRRVRMFQRALKTAFGGCEKGETYTGLFDAVKTKRYSHARIRRIVLSAYLGITNDLPNLPPYLRILGMTKLWRGDPAQSKADAADHRTTCGREETFAGSQTCI